MRKSLLIILGCVFSVIIFQAFTTHQQPKWKNLQVLPQDISEAKLDSIMDHFKVSLGVKCNFCHARNTDLKKMDFPSDEKPEKQIARKMMMMAMDINQKYFTQIEQEMEDAMGANKKAAPATHDSTQMMLQYVSCYTCHQGKERPVNAPPEIKEDPAQQ